jgi:hypothetical protein
MAVSNETKEFYVIAHNPASVANEQMIRVKLNKKDYISFDGDKEIANDVFEQSKYGVDGNLNKFYEMFIPVNLGPNEVKMIQLKPGQTKKPAEQLQQKLKLEIQGLGEEGQAVIQLTNGDIS